MIDRFSQRRIKLLFQNKLLAKNPVKRKTKMRRNRNAPSLPTLYG